MSTTAEATIAMLARMAIATAMAADTNKLRVSASASSP